MLAFLLYQFNSRLALFFTHMYLNALLFTATFSYVTSNHPNNICNQISDKGENKTRRLPEWKMPTELIRDPWSELVLRNLGPTSDTYVDKGSCTQIHFCNLLSEPEQQKHVVELNRRLIRIIWSVVSFKKFIIAWTRVLSGSVSESGSETEFV